MFGLLLVNNQQIHFVKCDAETCLFLHRKQDIFSFKNDQPLEIRLKNELFFKLHLYLSHSYDLKYRLTPGEEQQLQQITDHNNSNSNTIGIATLKTPFGSLVDHISKAKQLQNNTPGQEQHYQRFNSDVNQNQNHNQEGRGRASILNENNFDKVSEGQVAVLLQIEENDEQSNKDNAEDDEKKYNNNDNDDDENGGVIVDYQYDGFTLANSDDEIIHLYLKNGMMLNKSINDILNRSMTIYPHRHTLLPPPDHIRNNLSFALILGNN
jgi:hypothetical protein